MALLWGQFKKAIFSTNPHFVSSKPDPNQVPNIHTKDYSEKEAHNLRIKTCPTDNQWY
jgi:hypothetical protein